MIKHTKINLDIDVKYIYERKKDISTQSLSIRMLPEYDVKNGYQQS